MSRLRYRTFVLSGEVRAIRVVSDNGPCYKAAAFARYIDSRPEFEHVRTRHAPQAIRSFEAAPTGWS